jgi:hypothetical protein
MTKCVAAIARGKKRAEEAAIESRHPEEEFGRPTAFGQAGMAFIVIRGQFNQYFNRSSYF